MKNIDIIGVFSNADLWGKKLPVLYKTLAACLKAKERYRLSKVYLLYGVSGKNESPLSPEETFLETYSHIYEGLKEHYPDVDLCLFKKPYFHEWNDEDLEDLQFEKKGIHLCLKKAKPGESLSTYSYYRFFSYCLASSQADAMLFNLQSGNPQTKEALQLAELSYMGKSFLYNESFKNKGSIHQNDNSAIAYLKDKGGHPEITEEKDFNPAFPGRVDAKAEDEELAREAHGNLVRFLIEKGNYLEAYRECVEHPYSLPEGKREVLLSLFSDYRSLRFDSDNRVSKSDVADYYFSRLAYLEALPKSERGDKLACSILNRLLYTLFHLECSPYVKREEEAFLVVGDEHYSAKEYERFIDRFNGDSYADNGKLFIDPFAVQGKDYPEKINPKNLKKFLSRYISFRHPSLDEYKKDSSEHYDPTSFLGSLKAKFDSQYCSYLSAFQGRSFQASFSKLKSFLLEDTKETRIEGYLLPPELKEGERVCLLSMAGSTDPGNLPEGMKGLFCYGSTLCFTKALENPEGCAKEAKEYLLPLKGEKLPLYFVLTAETASFFFKESKLSYEDLKEIYGGHDLRLVPFARNGIGNAIRPRKRVSSVSSLKEKDLLDLQSYGEEEKGYSYELCFDFVSELIHALLNQYDRIYLVESSGLPNCKTALAFFSAFYPERIKTFSVKSPQDFYNFKDPRPAFKPGKDTPISFDAPIPELTASPTLLELILNEERSSALLLSYLEQAIDYDDLEEDSLKGFSSEERERMKEHDEKELSKQERVARELAKAHFLIEDGKPRLALECMDFCLESIFGGNRAEGMKEAREMAHGDSTLVRLLNPLAILWEAASDIKHNETSFVLNEVHLSMLLSFDPFLQRKYKEELEYYKWVKRAFFA